MAEYIDPIDSLPYPNWHDSVGRVFKDVLIKNFNTLEEKINEILKFDYNSLKAPTVTGVEYPDTTLETEDNTSILNLKSFLSICNIVDYPLDVRTDGNMKVLSVSLWNRSHKYVTISATSDNGTATTSYPYIFLNKSTYEIMRSNDINLNTDTYILLAVLIEESKLITNNEAIPGNVNFLKVLADQDNTKETVSMAIDFTTCPQAIKHDMTVLGYVRQSKYHGNTSVDYTPYFLTGKLRKESD